MVVAIYRLHETRKDTYNIPGLIKLLEEDSSIWKSDFKIIAVHHEKIPEDIFAEANITYDQFAEKIEESTKWINHISHIVNNSTYAFNTSPQEDLIRMLEDLNSIARKSS